MPPPIFHPPLYLITDRRQTGGRPLEDVVEAALAGGVRAIQLRERDLPTRNLLSLAQTLRALTRRYSACLLINHRIDICLACEADGIHLRSNSLPTRVVRKILGDQKIIGVSVHSLQEARQAQDEGASFVALGPVYPTASKQLYGRPIGLKTLRTVRAAIQLPLYALGGIRAAQIREVLAGGADGVALISAILSAENPRQSAEALLLELHPAR